VEFGLVELGVMELSERRQRRPKAQVAVLIAGAVAGAATGLGFAAGGIADALRDRLGASLAFLAVTVLLQLFALRLPGSRGSIGVSAVGLVAAGIVLGTGPAMLIGVCAALAQYLRSRGIFHRALFDAANFCLAAGAAGLVYQQLADLGHSGALRLAAALLAGFAYTAVNHGLLCLAMGLSEARSPLVVWRERFHFARYHFLAFGALALLAASAYNELGPASLLALVIPPVLLAQSIRDSLGRLRARAA
jgi:hypothetical protein